MTFWHVLAIPALFPYDVIILIIVHVSLFYLGTIAPKKSMRTVNSYTKRDITKTQHNKNTT